MIEQVQGGWRFVVVGDVRHTVVVRAAVPAGMTNDPMTHRQWEQGALDLARQRFAAHGVSHGDLQVKGIWDGEAPLDDFHQLGLSEEGLIQAAMRLYNDDDLTVDANAVLSGLNIQIWQYMEPEDVMTHLADSGPITNVRSMPAMTDTISLQDATIEALRHALVTCRIAFDRLANGEPFNVVVEQTGCTAAVVGALNDTSAAERQGALQICEKLGIQLDCEPANVHEAAFKVLRARYAEDWVTAVIQGGCYEGLLQYAQDAAEQELDEGMQP